MKEIKGVLGSAEQARPLVIGWDTVYVHTNIRPAIRKRLIDGEFKEIELPDMYEYDEIQYTKDEYIELMAQQSKQLSTELLDTQLALCELYETLGGEE